MDKEDILNNLCEYLNQKPTEKIRQNGVLNTKYKAYNYFSNARVVHNQIVIHFTNMEGNESIFFDNSGFLFGTQNLDDLAYTKGKRRIGKKRI